MPLLLSCPLKILRSLHAYPSQQQQCPLSWVCKAAALGLCQISARLWPLLAPPLLKIRSEDPSVHAFKGGGLGFLIKNLYYEDIAVNIPNTADLEAQGIKVYLNQNNAINLYNMYHPSNNKLIDNGKMAIFLQTTLFLLHTFNNFWKTGKLPQDWKTATIIPIKKLEKSADDPKNYRPISLTSICCKLMEKGILRRLNYHPDRRNLLPEE
ncbi:hypothetical protein LAZ67_X002513 [Cordylochernes scorpioides]|uniref:Reverse transcriptase n=1 Tax=Cordylochernes scorpioides TaxID=51811 RepID=A0ABY6LYC7_9ARAC|nr:hypothetical protein LAZ67_X002513 [Cordylochernes scorpioides]